ncbi:uncharacterized protein HMPREF1541_06161 [Cyphellophora europaea CBS 101466]|uniref:3-oxoacyl-[acyl-carrier protein] reductase n=1 Tax=Cyphellophora europaea (strain CBS 101466) TaxID=1220924 RepID=W2RW75_CYPE1|nr:uncharacterized protein HMPREF1541_06161 [Cyphellophora europaea CBS 101466]ETN39934.1 hypothetical protein HMPREF1541_06161 [Cyphellophora europaea CBS 101466]
MVDTNFTPDTHLALITGATGGIGRATCHALARLGISVAAHFNAAKDDAEVLVQELTEQYQVRAACFQADLGDYDAVHRLHASVVATLGHPNILFLNAGTTGGVSGVKNLTEVPFDVFEQTWRINCGSNILLTQLCLPALTLARSGTTATEPWGRIIFNSSAAAFTGGLVGPHYASSKSALHGLIHWLAASVASRGITVNGIAPALIEGTKMLPGAKEELRKKVPVGRLGTGEEVAETVVWMVRNGEFLLRTPVLALVRFGAFVLRFD